MSSCRHLDLVNVLGVNECFKIDDSRVPPVSFRTRHSYKDAFSAWCNNICSWYGTWSKQCSCLMLIHNNVYVHTTISFLSELSTGYIHPFFKRPTRRSKLVAELNIHVQTFCLCKCCAVTTVDITCPNDHILCVSLQLFSSKTLLHHISLPRSHDIRCSS